MSCKGKARETFGSRFAVIMAMAGSAIGLGNIWRFPYVVGEYGGAAFILVYVLCTFLLALPIFLSESIIGRRSGSNTFGAMEKLAPGTSWKWMGLLTVISPVVILSYYSVVGGWSVEYLFKSLAFEFTNTPADNVPRLFGTFITSSWEPLFMLGLFLMMVAGIVLAGVKSGIERFSKITMPVLFLLIVVMLVYSVTLPGSSEGVAYLLKPDFSKLSASAVAAAMGQAFFSLSLGVGTILTYSSYVRKDENLLVSGIGTGISDLLFALLAGFAVMPAVFACGVEPGAGPGLVFQTLPFIFNKMGAGAPLVSSLVAIVFFVTILVAALTSAISMMEVGVAYLVENRGFSRLTAVASIFCFALVVGALCSLSFGTLSDVKIFGNTIFDALDKLCSNFLMTFGGLLFTLFVGWKMKKADVEDELTNGGSLHHKCVFRVVYFLIRYVAPIAIIAIFITNLFL
ncbi:neurotransmitter:Na+ symporter, NSS family [Bacteroidales bacterium WCE2008]|nr:sodium-dependent transporter [Bacteroidales bacterium]SKC34989.1 neurotransmitter:Na+ symporter, NSS family [Bacteroidales bacterium WCE2008]